MKKQEDFKFMDSGSICLLRPVSKRAEAWVNENIDRGGYQPYWPTVVVEPRYTENVIQGIMDDGLAIPF